MPTTGPKTVNGLITQHLEALPEPGTSLKLGDFQIDILRTRGTSVQMARIRRIAPPPED
jgi:Mg2+/Co2+ transporter CorB